MSALVEEYQAFAISIGRLAVYGIPGADEDDLRQEALIGLYEAARDYRPGRGATFKSFAAVCVRRAVITALKRASRLKHGVLTDAARVGDAGDADNDIAPLVELQAAPNTDAGEMMERRDVLRLVASGMDQLTPMEACVMRGFMDGGSYAEIAERCGVRPKQVDNAYARARVKLLRHLEEAA